MQIGLGFTHVKDNCMYYVTEKINNLIVNLNAYRVVGPDWVGGYSYYILLII